MSDWATFSNQIKGLLHKVHAQHKACALKFVGTGSIDLVRQRTVNIPDRR
jgi:hypothetical protein